MKSRNGAIIGGSCGLLVGILMLAPFEFYPLQGAADSIWSWCNGPALLLSCGFAGLWTWLGLMPQGDFAGMAVMLDSWRVTIIIQWVVIGAIVGLLVARRYFKTATAICGGLVIVIVSIVFWFVAGQWLFMDKTVAAIMKMGGQFTVDNSSPNKPIVEVCLNGFQVNDADLIQLKGLIQLRQLYLGDCPNITDAGLEHLKGLNQLQTLILILCPTITDAGLKHLEVLANLHTLYIVRCRGITNAGVKRLQEANPHLSIQEHLRD